MIRKKSTPWKSHDEITWRLYYLPQWQNVWFRWAWVYTKRASYAKATHISPQTETHLSCGKICGQQFSFLIVFLYIVNTKPQMGIPWGHFNHLMCRIFGTQQILPHDTCSGWNIYLAMAWENEHDDWRFAYYGARRYTKIVPSLYTRA